MATKELTTAVLAGAAAGAIGTLAMDLVWFRRARNAGSDDSFSEWEFSHGTTSFDDAGAPAHVAATVIRHRNAIAATAVGAATLRQYRG